MSKRTILILLLSIAGCLLVNAQKKSDTVVYYMNANEVAVSSKDNADFYRLIVPDDADKTLFEVQDYYKNMKPRAIGKTRTQAYSLLREGAFIEYFPSGKRKAIKNYKDNTLFGDITQYFPNGKLYLSGYYDKDTRLIINECRDSTGKLVLENGNGHYIKYDQDFKHVVEEGDVKDNQETGEWHGSPNDSVKYFCTYEKGVIRKGTSYCKGKEYSFTQIEVEPTFEGGMEGFYKFLSHNIHYPAMAKEDNIQGKVIISFIVNKDGTLSDLSLIKGIGGGCDEESARVIQASSPWIPGYQYGIPVRLLFTVPITYTITSADKQH